MGLLVDYSSFVQFLAAVYLSLCIESLSQKLLHIQRPILKLTSELEYKGLLGITDIDGNPYRLKELRDRRKRKFVIRFFLIKSFLWIGLSECILFLIFCPYCSNSHNQLLCVISNPFIISDIFILPFLLYWFFYKLTETRTGKCFERGLDLINDKHLHYYKIVFLGNYHSIDDKAYLTDFLKILSDSKERKAVEVAEELKFREIKKYVDNELDSRPRYFKKLLNDIYLAGKRKFFLKDEVVNSLTVNAICRDVSIPAKGGETNISVDYSYEVSTTTNGYTKQTKATTGANVDYSLLEQRDWCSIDSSTGKIIVSPNKTQFERTVVVRAKVQIEHLVSQSLCTIRQCPQLKKQSKK